MFSCGCHGDLKRALETVRTAIAIFGRHSHPEFELISANSLFGQAFDCTVEACIGQSLNDVFPGYVADALLPAMHRCIAQLGPEEIELAFDRKGTITWWHGIICVDLNQRIQLMNEAAKTMFGVDDSIVGIRLETLLPHRFRSQHEHYTSGFRQSPIASRSMALRAALFGQRSDGTEFPLDIAIAKITVQETTEMMAVMRDNSDRARLIEELELSATTDFLTNVPNRRALMNTATTEFSRSVRFGRAMSVLMFDIDHFKHVNDNFGHPAGDLVLKNIVNHAKTALREVDMLGRWGGEEFVVILPETDEDAAMKCAERLRLAVESRPFPMSDAGVEAAVTVSVGVATRSDADETVDALFSRVDGALYRAKQAGRNQISA